MAMLNNQMVHTTYTHSCLSAYNTYQWNLCRHTLCQLVPTFLGCSLFRSPGMKGCGLRQDISEKGDLLKKCFAGGSISEDGVKWRIFFTNPTRGIWKYMECKGIFSQHVVLYGVVQKWGQGFQVWSSGILYFTILLSLYTCYTSIYCISGISRPNLESHRIPIPILVVRFVGMGSKFEETRWTPSRTAL